MTGEVVDQVREYTDQAQEAAKNFKPFVENEGATDGHVGGSCPHRSRAGRTLEKVVR
jgi:hypothetical protein